MRLTETYAFISGNVAPTSSKVYIDGKETEFLAYNIGGNNYYMLRGLGKTFDFAVEWNSETNSIHIDTSKSYTK